MKKFLKKFILLTAAFSLVFATAGILLPQQASAQGVCFNAGVSLTGFNTREECVNAGGQWVTNPEALQAVAGGGWWDWGGWVMDKTIEPALAFIATVVLKIVSFLTGLAAVILNAVIYYSIVKSTAVYNIPAISEAWRVIRDVANMGFIFILLYAAIQTILGVGTDNKKLIMRIVLVAILINFSLFFTKVVIDASNVLAIFFYDRIAPGALNTTLEWSPNQWGLSTAFMDKMNLHTLYETGQAQAINSGQIVTIGVMGSLMLLIATFIFFAVAIMLIIRYVALLLVLILSPIAFVSFVYPGLGGPKTQWWKTLLGQGFFAPIYFLLTWVTLQVLSGIMTATTTVIGGGAGAEETRDGLSGLAIMGDGLTNIAKGSLVMFLNYAVVIAFLIASLILAKDWANKAGPAAKAATKWATRFAGGATFGMAGRFGRNTIGRAGQAMSESETLKKARQWSDKRGGLVGGLSGFGIRKIQQGTGRVGSSSFDLRATGINKQLDAGKAQKGGYQKWREDTDKAEEKYAKSLGPSAKTKAKARRAYEDAKESYGPYSPQALAAQRVVDKLEGVKADELKKRANTQIEQDEIVRGEKRANEVLKQARENFAKEEIMALKREKELEDEFNKKRQEIENEINQKQKEINETVIPEMKRQRENALEVRKRELDEELNLRGRALEEARRNASDRRKAFEADIKSMQENADEFKRRAAARRSEIEKQYAGKSGEIESVKSLADDRKEDFAKAVQSSAWAKFRGYNYTAAAQIRKGKSAGDKAKELIKEMEKEDGGEEETKKDEEKPETPPEAPAAPAGGAPTT